jgi:alanine racemase
VASVRALARVNLGAIERNVARLAREAPGSAVCAVVKAEGYGHGMVASALAALDGGATWLAVATAREAADLRAGLDAAGRVRAPILVLGAISDSELPIALDADADISVWSADRARALAHARRRVRVHVKLDSGLGRLGQPDAREATAVAELIAAADGPQLVGLWTHFATADERADRFFGEQLARFQAWAEPLRAAHPHVLLHAANSAALLRNAASHFDIVRPGIAIYGLDPFGEDPAERQLEPALELASYVAAVKVAHAGDTVGYGRRFIATTETRIATVPIGYGDGWRRATTDNADALVRGRRVPLVGTVSMDNTTIDVGVGDAAVGDAVTLIGPQGTQRILAEEVARRTGTINYEITTALAARVAREHHRDGVSLESDRPDR